MTDELFTCADVMARSYVYNYFEDSKGIHIS